MSSQKTKRAAIAAKRKRMGLSAVDKNDMDAGDAFDPQLVTIAKSKQFLKVFEKKAGSLHGSVSFDEFRECLEELEIEVASSDARKAFKALDLENEDELEFEAFCYSLFVAYPNYNIIWNEILKTKKYYHFRTIEGPYSEEQIKSILKNKNGSLLDKMAALRCCVGMIGAPEIKDKETRQLLIKLLPGLLAALRDKNESIVNEACISIGLCAKGKKSNLKSQVSKILNVCWELFDSKSELIRYSSSMASKCLLKYVPDDGDNKCLKTLIQGTQLKGYEGVQKGCYDGIKTYLKKSGNPKNKKQPNKEFWQLMKNIITDALQSDNKDTKQRGYECLYEMEKSNDKKSSRITTGFTVKQQKEYKNICDGKSIDNNDDDNDNDNKEEEETMTWEPDKSKRGPRQLSRDYDERKDQLSESFDAYDDDGEEFLSTDRTVQFLRDLFEITGQDADIAIRGLDIKFDGHIQKPRMIKWCLAHSWKKVRKNKYLENEGKKFGYSSSRKTRLQERIDIFEKLKEIELAEHNYTALYDIDHRVCVLNYCMKNAKK